MFAPLAVCVLLLSQAHGFVMPNLEIPRDGNRIMNGLPAIDGEFPSQLSVRNYGTHVCGASILNSEWALTTGTCVSTLNIAGISILSGSIDRHSRNGTVHNVTEITIHPEHITWDIRVNDIAVVQVSPPFDLDGFLRKAILLPAQGSSLAEFTTATIVGWGRLQQGGPPADILQKVDVVVSNQTACRVVLHSKGFDLAETQICADIPQEGLGSCYGDEGGPMFVNEVAVGLVSWGEGCAPMAYEYSIFTRVSSYIDWINSCINN